MKELDRFTVESHFWDQGDERERTCWDNLRGWRELDFAGLLAALILIPGAGMDWLRIVLLLFLVAAVEAQHSDGFSCEFRGFVG